MKNIIESIYNGHLQRRPSESMALPPLWSFINLDQCHYYAACVTTVKQIQSTVNCSLAILMISYLSSYRTETKSIKGNMSQVTIIHTDVPSFPVSCTHNQRRLSNCWSPDPYSVRSGERIKLSCNPQKHVSEACHSFSLGVTIWILYF